MAQTSVCGGRANRPALFFLLVLAASTAFAQPGDLAAKSQRGKQLLAAGQFEEAIAVYKELVQAVPGNPGLVLNLGIAQHMARRDAEAVASFEAVLRGQPQAVPALVLLGASYLRLDQPAKAAGPLEKAVLALPEDKEARQMLADALLGAERQEAAAPHLRRLAQWDPDKPKVWHALGRCYETLAQRAYAKLDQGARGSAYWLALAGEVRLKQKRYGSAFGLYREAAAKMPELRGVHAALAEIYRSTNHADWASIEESKEQQLAQPDCKTRPAECHFLAGRYEAAVSAVRSGVTPTAWYWKSRAYSELARQTFARLGQLPASVELHILLAEVHRGSGRHVESIEQWRAALKLAPADRRMQQELATSVYLSRDYRAAEPLIRELLKGEPESAELNFLLGDTLLSEQQAEQAVALLAKAVQSRPKFLPAQAALGRALQQLGQSARAVAHLKAALPIDDDGSLHYQLSRAYLATGQQGLAAELLGKYQELQKLGRTDGPEPAITPP